MEKRTNFGMKRNYPIKDPHIKVNAPPVPHRTKITPKNKRAISIAKSTRELLKEFRDNRVLESYTDAIEYLITRVYDLEKLVMIFKDIFDLATEKEDYRFLHYGFNRKMTPESLIMFNELLGWSKNGEK